MYLQDVILYNSTIYSRFLCIMYSTSVISLTDSHLVHLQHVVYECIHSFVQFLYVCTHIHNLLIYKVFYLLYQVHSKCRFEQNASECFGQTSNKYYVGTNFNQERERERKNATVQNRHLAIHRHDRKYQQKIT